MRWLVELFNKSKKCQRVGHDLLTIKHKIRKEHDGYRSVAADYHAKIDSCYRCNKRLSEPYDLEMINSWNECGMPPEDWDQIRKNGYLIL